MHPELSNFFEAKAESPYILSKSSILLSYQHDCVQNFRDSLICNKIGFSVPYLQHVRQLLSRRRHVIIVLAHWLVHAYGILAVTLLRNPAVHGPLFSLVLAPVLFYLVTHSFTEPNKFKT